MKLINKTPNGQIMFCPFYNTFHLEFGNLFFHMAPDEFETFRNYVGSIDYSYYLSLNRDAQNRRKLLLSVGARKSYLALHAHELTELRALLSLKKHTGIIRNLEVIGQELIYN